MADYLIQDTTLTDIADKIRVLSGTEETMTPTVMADTLEAHNTEMNAIASTQDDIIAQITAALEGKSGISGGAGGGGGSVVVNTITTTASNPSITIADAAGKDNVALMFVTSGSYQASAMADAGLGNVLVNGDSHYYNILYMDSMYADSNDGFIKYDKSTGTISIASNMRYNETFVKGTYVYVTW